MLKCAKNAKSILETVQNGLNIVSQFYRKYGKLTLFNNSQCTTKLKSHVPQNPH